MTGNAILGIVTAATTIAFVVMLAVHYRGRPRASIGSWLIGGLFYLLGVVCQTAIEMGFLSGLIYRVWYLSGAFFAAAFLGMGSVHLIGRPRLASWSMRGLCWSLAIVTPIVLTAPLDLGLIDAHALSGAALPPYVRVLTPFFNIFGTVTLVGVAFWSAYRLGRQGAPFGADADARGRFWSVTMIAIGALVAASGSTLLRFGLPSVLYVTQLLGIGLIWLGYLLGRATSDRSRESPMQRSGAMESRSVR